MSIVIQKYGGTSLGSIERIRHVAEIIIREKNAGSSVVVVASAMSGVTNDLFKLSSQCNLHQDSLSTKDFVLATGENVSAGLLSLVLQSFGMRSMPLAGWQLPIRTDNTHGNAKIVSVNTERIFQLLDQGIIPVVSGFQGITDDAQITTLGRGGSDTTAAALAAAVKADRCDIYTDIDGVYTADPRLAMGARFIPQLGYSQAYQMSRLGSKVLHPRAVEHCWKSGILLRVLSSFDVQRYTNVSSDALPTNSHGVVGVSNTNSSLLLSLKASREIGEQFINNLTSQNIFVDSKYQEHQWLIFLDLSDESKVKIILQEQDLLHLATLSEAYGKVSLVGLITSEIYYKVQNQLKMDGINMLATFSSPAYCSFVINPLSIEKAANQIHDLFWL
jgi:aspartate kinase